MVEHLLTSAVLEPTPGARRLADRLVDDGWPLATLTAAMALDPVPIDDDVAEQWARLRVILRETGQRMPVNDSWIAATAMALAVPIVTRDDDDIQLDELLVIRV